MNTGLAIAGIIAAALVVAAAVLIVARLTRIPITTPTITFALVTLFVVRLNAVVFIGLTILAVLAVCVGLTTGLITIDQTLHWVTSFTTTIGDALAKNTPTNNVPAPSSSP